MIEGYRAAVDSLERRLPTVSGSSYFAEKYKSDRTLGLNTEEWQVFLAAIEQEKKDREREGRSGQFVDRDNQAAWYGAKYEPKVEDMMYYRI